MKIWRMVMVFSMILGMASISNAAAYMKLGDIKGESTDNEHKDWIIIESMSSPVSRAIVDVDSTGQCSLGLRGDTTLGDVVIVKELDKSSPKIQEAVCGETFFEEVTIDIVSSTKHRGQEPYLRYELKNVFVTSYSVGAGTNGEGEAVPIEDFSLNYGEIKFEYVPAKGKGDNDNKP